MDCQPYSHPDLMYDAVASRAVVLLQNDAAPSRNGSSSVQVLGLHHPLATSAVD